jgi:hypothetical protein
MPLVRGLPLDEDPSRIGQRKDAELSRQHQIKPGQREPELGRPVSRRVSSVAVGPAQTDRRRSSDERRIEKWIASPELLPPGSKRERGIQRCCDAEIGPRLPLHYSIDAVHVPHRGNNAPAELQEHTPGGRIFPVAAVMAQREGSSNFSKVSASVDIPQTCQEPLRTIIGRGVSEERSDLNGGSRSQPKHE